MIMSKQISSLTIIVIICLMVMGCATYQAKTVSVCQIDGYSTCTKKDGISFAADPFDNSGKAKDAFYADVTSRGYYPVQLIFKNDTSENIMVLRGTVELDSAGGMHQTVRSSNMYNDFEHNKMAYALLGFGIFSYMSAEEANRKMESDWREKEMPEQLIIPPGRTSHGFVYFKLSQGASLRGSKLKVQAERMADRKIVKLEVTL
jgi:hypothetical protein